MSSLHLSMWSTLVKIQPDCPRLWLFNYVYCTHNSTRLNILSLHHVLRASRQLTASTAWNSTEEEAKQILTKTKINYIKRICYEEMCLKQHYIWCIVTSWFSSVILTGIHPIPVSIDKLTAKFNRKSNASAKTQPARNDTFDFDIRCEIVSICYCLVHKQCNY